MLVEKGEKLHVITRRYFENDLRRHFVGEVQSTTENSARVEGFVFVFDVGTGQYLRRQERRVRIISLLDAGNIINVLPLTINVDDLSYQISEKNRLVLADGRGYSLDINEFSTIR